ncbi:MAG: diacylglycerol/lipid kinase family protein [Alphaproteobacteria bacterium]|jgi:diacylglycerol kinase (ATP)
MPRILVIHNPTAGRRRARIFQTFLRLLTESGAHEIRVEATMHPGHGREIASVATDVDIIVAVGGDGTVNEIVEGLCARPPGVAFPAIAFLPMGTVNVLALELGLPRDPARAVDIIEQGAVLRMRPGIANDRRFLLMASVGLDARAVAAVTAPMKRRFGKLAYLLGAVTAMKAPPPFFRVEMNGGLHEGRMVIATRGRCYAGPFKLTPGGGLRTSELNVVIFKSHGILAALRYGLAVAMGRLHRLSDVEILTLADIQGADIQITNIQINGPENDPVQIDGDTGTAVPLSIALADREVSILVPTVDGR